MRHTLMRLEAPLHLGARTELSPAESVPGFESCTLQELMRRAGLREPGLTISNFDLPPHDLSRRPQVPQELATVLRVLRLPEDADVARGAAQTTCWTATLPSARSWWRYAPLPEHAQNRPQALWPV